MTLNLLNPTLALRNLGRHRGRTTSTLTAIVVGLVGLILLDGYVQYSMWGLKETLIHSGTGHLQVALHPAYFDEGDSDPFPFALPDSKKLVKELRRMPEVKDVLPTVNFAAVAGARGLRETIQVRAFPFDRAGNSLGFLTLVRGTNLTGPGGLAVGEGLAHKLGVGPGDSLELLAVDRTGSVSTQSFPVTGVVSSGVAALDAVLVYLDLADAAGLLGTDEVPQLTVYLERTEDTEAVAARLRASPPDHAPAGAVWRTWDDLSPSYEQANGSYQMVLGVSRIIVLIVALFSISGTLALSIMERHRELGTLRALGTRKTSLIALLAWEGGFLGLAGAVLGTLAGLGLAGVLNLLGGLKMAAQPGMSHALSIYFQPDLGNLGVNAVLVTLAAGLGALVPGFWAVRRPATELLRST